MQSVGRLWLANIARGAWSGERASGGGMGVFGMGESSHPISGAIERGEIHAARPPGESDSADRDRKSERR